MSKIILQKYINQDLTKDSTWKSLVYDCNQVAEKTHNDCLTQKIFIAITEYLEEVYRVENPDNLLLIEKSTPPEQKKPQVVTGFEVKGFQVN